LIQRHEILRSNFIQDGEHLYQKIHAQIDWHVNLTSHPLEEVKQQGIQEKIKPLIDKLCIEPFDLEKDSLLRIHLVAINDNLHYCVIVMHHIIGDAWSTEVLLRELVTLYLFDEGTLPTLDIQYAEYAAWQREWLQGEVLEKQIAFWKAQLQGAENLDLPFDRLRPIVESHRGGRVAIKLDVSVYERLKKLAEKHKATLFMVLMSAFQVLLYSYSQQKNFVVGTPIANRDKEELVNQIGFYINTLAVRADVDNKDSFIDLLAKVRARLLDAYSHQDVPFEQIVDALDLPRNTSHAPVFQNMLVLNSSSFANEATKGIDAQQLAGKDVAELKISLMEHEQINAKFDLNCELVESADGLQGHLEYNRDLFDAESAEQLACHFSKILLSICEHPEQEITGIALLGQYEREQLLSLCRGESAVYAQQQSVGVWLDEALAHYGE